MKNTAFLLATLLIVSLLIAGCGGNGGGERALSGTVSDVAGNFVPGADIFLDGRQVTTSLMNGTYKIDRLPSGDHNIEAVAIIDGKEWTGTRAVDVFGDGPTQTQNVVIGPWDELGDITGTVTNASGDPIGNARVIALARYPQDRPADEASVISKVVVANLSGRYTIDNLPSSITVDGDKEEILYDVIASSVGESGQPRGFDNQTKTATVGEDALTRLDFTLLSSSDVTPDVPTGWTSSGALDIIGYTVATSIPTRAADSAYDAVKSSASKRSAKAIALKRKAARRSPPTGSLIENNVIWYSIWTDFFSFDLPENLAGFAIYRGPTSQIEQTGRFRIDFARDPALVTYSDASNELTAGVTYWYGVSAVSTSYLDANDQFNPAAESDMSSPVSVTPLGKLNATSPQDNASVDVPNPRFTWQALSRARTYKVFIYSDYPVVDSLFTPQGDAARPDHLPSWGESNVVTGTSVTFSDPNFTLVAGNDYWWVVMASDNTDFDLAHAYAISELRSFVAR